MMHEIKKMDITTVLLESGPILINKFLDKNLINEFYLFRASQNINNLCTIDISNTLKKISNNFKQKKLINTYLDKDKLVKYF